MILVVCALLVVAMTCGWAVFELRRLPGIRHARALERIRELEAELDPAGDGLAWTDDDEKAEAKLPEMGGLPPPDSWRAYFERQASAKTELERDPDPPKKRELFYPPVLDEAYFTRKAGNPFGYRSGGASYYRFGANVVPIRGGATVYYGGASMMGPYGGSGMRADWLCPHGFIYPECPVGCSRATG